MIDQISGVINILVDSLPIRREDNALLSVGEWSS
jgi:hypothetical protein